MTSKNELIFGIHAVKAVLDHVPESIKVLYLQKERHDKRFQAIHDKAKSEGVTIELIPKASLDELTNFGQHQGIVARCSNREHYYEADLPQLLAASKTPPLLLILDQIQDPHNLGACLRSAEAAGVCAVIVPKDHSVGLTPTVRKVASGAAENVSLIQVTNLSRTMKQLREEGVWIYGLAEEADKNLFQANLSGAVALVLGAEGEGLRRLTREGCDELLSIPMAGRVQSLNVSVAAGVCLFEVIRQRMLA